MAIVDLECEFRYEAAHWLPFVPDDHQCGRMHGHSYHLTVVVRGPVKPDGFVVDFADVKSAVAPLVKQLDHHTLNDIWGLENPTVENQLVWLWNRLISIDLVEIRLRETANNTAVYRGKLDD
jgi:6-pyruvoyltetrahydropterin/6-carboxytetrahydropterin synthase